MLVLVTGAAGFLGSHLVNHHLERGDKVIGVDDFSSSSQTSKHLSFLCKNQNFDFIKMNICKQQIANEIENFCYHQNIDLIYNFACPASPPIYQKKPFHTLDTCFLGTRNILKLAHQHNSRVLHASTSEIYGDPLTSPQAESYKGNVNSYGPRACYDEGKRVAEALCYEYAHKNLDVRVVRIFNTYGPHMSINDGRVVTNFIKQSLKNEDITVYGDGKQTRSFCYVSDLISGLTKITSLEKSDQIHLPINVGNSAENTVLDLAKQVISLTGSNSKIVHKDLPKDDPCRRNPDITRISNLTNWSPEISLKAGLTKTINYIKENIIL